MRVMVWNVWWRYGGNWRERESSILATLETYRPDVLGLVDSWSGDGTDQPRRLAAPFDMHATWAPSPVPPKKHPVPYAAQQSIGIGIGLASRWPILAAECRPLPNPQRGGPPPSVLLATVDHPRAPLHVIVARTESDPGYPGDHLSQCHHLALLAADPRLDGPLPVLLLAGLSAGPGHPALTPMLDTMIDTWASAGADPAAVTLDSSVPYAAPEPAGERDRRVDHVLARPGHLGATVSVTGAFLAGDRPVAGTYPSTHYAVGVDLEP